MTTTNVADNAVDVREWEARAQVNIATLIEVYLAQHPEPAPSKHADLYRHWASELRVAGQAALTQAGARPLVGV